MKIEMVKFYKNRRSYFIQSNVDIDTSKLVDVDVIDSQEDAERDFRVQNSIPENEGVYIPSLTLKDGVLYGTTLNDCTVKVEGTAEDYINDYDL